MAIADYATLQTKIASWMHRADLTAMIPDFIALAEQRMNADLVARDMETTATLNMVAGVATLATPPDVIETRRLVVNTDPKRTLDYIAPERLTIQYPSSTSGTPEVYTVIGGNFQFAPIPDSSYTAEYIYRQRIPALSASNTTNWILSKWPYIYLYGALCAAAPYMKDDKRIIMLEHQYQSMVDDVNSVDWYSGATMMVRAV